MPYVIGIVISVGVALLGRYGGYDRDRAFYPTVLISSGITTCYSPPWATRFKQCFWSRR